MTEAPATLLLPGLLTFILYVAALFAVVASRRAVTPPRIRRQRAPPRLRILPGGAARASGRG